MSRLSWNYSWSEESGASWPEYLRNRDIVDAINGGQASAASCLSSCMTNEAERILGGIDGISRTLEGGFGNLDESLRDLSATFTWGTNEVLAAMGGMQATLEALLHVAKTPTQTAAYEQFEIARRAYAQSLLPECLRALERAINGVPGITVGYEMEWRFHHLCGLVRLGSFATSDVDLVDPAAAEKAFLLAARYARADSPDDSAKALLAAGWAAYVQQCATKLPDALKHTEEALRLDPALGEALFQAAKLRMRLGDASGGLQCLLSAAELSSTYLVKASADADFLHVEGALDRFLARLSDETTQRLREVARPALMHVADLLSQGAPWRHDAFVVRLEEAASGDMSLPEAIDAAKTLEENRRRLDRAASELRERALAAANAARKGLAGHAQVLDRMPEISSSPEAAMLRAAASMSNEVQLAAGFQDVQENLARLDEIVRGLRKRVHLECRETFQELHESIEVEEPTGETERFFEDVVVRPAQWFKRAVIERVERTRPAVRRVIRPMTRRESRSTIVVVDAVGDPTGREFGAGMVDAVRIEPGTFERYHEHRNPFLEPELWVPPTGREQSVTLTTAIQVWRYPVTQLVYSALMEANPSRFPGGQRPVEGVHWLDAVEFCNAFSRANNLPEAYAVDNNGVTWHGLRHSGWRLPTEAEWEWCCLAGASGLHSWGYGIDFDPPYDYQQSQYVDKGSRYVPRRSQWVAIEKSKDWRQPGLGAQRQHRGGVTTDHMLHAIRWMEFIHEALEQVAWFGSNSGGETHAVGEKGSNRFGLYDMLGNVWEWCWESRGDAICGAEYEVGGRVAVGRTDDHVVRGGDCISSACYVKADCRTFNSWQHGAGFRLVRSVL